MLSNGGSKYNSKVNFSHLVLIEEHVSIFCLGNR